MESIGTALRRTIILLMLAAGIGPCIQQFEIHTPFTVGPHAQMPRLGTGDHFRTARIVRIDDGGTPFGDKVFEITQQYSSTASGIAYDVAISDREIRLPGWDQPLSFRDDPGFDDYR